MLKYSFFVLITGLFLISCRAQTSGPTPADVERLAQVDLTIPDTIEEVVKSAEEWKEVLSDQEYYVLREKGTERSFTGRYWDNKETGIYSCRGCGLPLFDSSTKFKSGTGWPSFWKPLEKKVVKEDTDFDIGYKRTEILCARCDGHLGHVFDDGPRPTGLRYCMNGASLDFVPVEEAKSE
ncbi:MAG: peptide-methionine (R)-S-oxide reductase [Saprospiraceae bacterium]|jgi:peptide-methionine (R)-S-oxide reductase